MNSMNNQKIILNEIFRKIISNCVEWKIFNAYLESTYYAVKMCPPYAIGLSGVRVLPLAAGINVGGHYKWHFQAAQIDRSGRF
jgi:hypothetical protein